MILYINGDSNAAGAEAVNPCAFAEDDGQYLHLGRRPHPENEKVSFGNLLADRLGWTAVNQAESASSNRRILRTTYEYLNENRPDAVVIGWSSWERDEWWHNNQWYQITCSGHDTVPTELETRYKNWVIEQSNRLNDCEMEAHRAIWDLHQDLSKENIPHLFFNCYSYFHWIVSNNYQQFDWNGSYIGPYDQSLTYHDWLVANGQKTVAPGSYHFGKEAHQKWAEFLYPQLTRLL